MVGFAEAQPTLRNYGARYYDPSIGRFISAGTGVMVGFAEAQPTLRNSVNGQEGGEGYLAEKILGACDS
jgi:hypothetical protein